MDTFVTSSGYSGCRNAAGWYRSNAFAQNLTVTISEGSELRSWQEEDHLFHRNRDVDMYADVRGVSGMDPVVLTTSDGVYHLE